MKTHSVRETRVSAILIVARLATPRRALAPLRSRRLGVGGMAETFEALRLGPGGFAQKVCLKRVLPAYCEDAEFVDQFQREARLAAALRHSNIVGVIDFGEEHGTHFMALELVDGIDLRELLAQRSNRRLSAEQVSLLALELAYALDYAHHLDGRGVPGGLVGVVHRDISPANVLISRAGEIKLADFGVAKAMSTAAATVSQGLRGKIPYMSPEQMRGSDVDGRADLFSLGVLLFEALAGERPFKGSHDVEVMTRLLNDERSAITDLVPDAPPALSEAIEGLLRTDVNQRIQSADELIDVLSRSEPSPQIRRELAVLVDTSHGGPATRDHVLEQRRISDADELRGSSSAPEEEVRAEAPKTISRKPLWFAIAAAIVLAAVGGYAYLRISKFRRDAENGGGHHAHRSDHHAHRSD
ncbi:MAG: serine/threonine-protein kinase [Polyangiales bacterium]